MLRRLAAAALCAAAFAVPAASADAYTSAQSSRAWQLVTNDCLRWPGGGCHSITRDWVVNTGCGGVFKFHFYTNTGRHDVSYYVC